MDRYVIVPIAVIGKVYNMLGDGIFNALYKWNKTGKPNFEIFFLGIKNTFQSKIEFLDKKFNIATQT